MKRTYKLTFAVVRRDQPGVLQTETRMLLATDLDEAIKIGKGHEHRMLHDGEIYHQGGFYRRGDPAYRAARFMGACEVVDYPAPLE